MRFWLSSCGQAAAISCSGRGVVAMVNFPGTAACSISPVAASSCDTDRLPIPLAHQQERGGTQHCAI
ncbi:Uncharacterised protein [Klebsiella pneumoniae]|nr:Uncharacterised protein [Klebsiella pneumoniae]